MESEIKFRITGTRPLIMHNGELADSASDVVKQIKEITSKGSKKATEADIEKRDWLEWFGGLYQRKGVLWMPSDNIERMVIAGAQKFRMGKDFASAVLCADDDGYEFKAEGTAGKSLQKIYDEKSADGSRIYVMRKLVCIQKNRIMRIRPKFAHWSIEFVLNYDTDTVSKDQVIRAVKEAEKLGMCDWRPKYGRFTSEVL